jgi:ribosome biogenesis GTPase A
MVKIQWYPGHMEKARRQMSDRLKAVDMIIELRDARIPMASRNPMLLQMAQTKPRLIVLSKTDEADPEKTEAWVKYLSAHDTKTIALDLMRDSRCGKKIIQASLALMKPKRDKQRARGIRPRAVRAMACGIPNVGKSTMINRIAGKNIAKAADKPGVTRSLTWIHADEQLDLLDTPGVLWPRFEDEMTGTLLAGLGSINDVIVDQKMLAMDMIHIIQDLYPGHLEEIYETESLKPNQMLRRIGEKRHFLKADGEVDAKRTAEAFLHDLRGGKLGRLTLEVPV